MKRSIYAKRHIEYEGLRFSYQGYTTLNFHEVKLLQAKAVGISVKKIKKVPILFDKRAFE